MPTTVTPSLSSSDEFSFYRVFLCSVLETSVGLSAQQSCRYVEISRLIPGSVAIRETNLGAKPFHATSQPSGSLRKADYAAYTDGLGYLAGYNRGADPKQTGRVIAVMPQSADKINTRSLGSL